MNAQRLEVVLADRRQGDLAVGQHGDLRAVRGVHRKGADAVDENRLYIGEVLHPEECELTRRHVPDTFEFLHLVTLSRIAAAPTRLTSPNRPARA